MEKHTCKLCYKSFSNGHALGGHMRSHMTLLKAQPTKFAREPEPQYSSSSSEDDESKALSLCYGLRENPRKSYRLADPHFAFTTEPNSVVQDRESETESSKIPSQRRSKRCRRSALDPKQNPNLDPDTESEPEHEPEPVSSVSDTTSEEDVAICLMMLSRDMWKSNNKNRDQELVSGDSDRIKLCSRGRNKFTCGTCKKVFRSYQALGGHRASHKKIKICSSGSVKNTLEPDHLPNYQKIHQCPICFRAFGSGQALGGHKRSHLSASASASASASSFINSTKFNDCLIDLNLPAPDDDASQVELSAVSDAEFVDQTA